MAYSTLKNDNLRFILDFNYLDGSLASRYKRLLFSWKYILIYFIIVYTSLIFFVNLTQYVLIKVDQNFFKPHWVYRRHGHVQTNSMPKQLRNRKYGQFFDQTRSTANSARKKLAQTFTVSFVIFFHINLNKFHQPYLYTVRDPIKGHTPFWVFGQSVP